ncbi:MAG TPA: hypothetical protein PLA83_12510 [Deltaproteobacteria bacterium]|nr:hypothetical protein [Deltaproteobacteria bacterium]HQI02855.1 hypothetical protein [Deltaproteobacteria bacterium]HQJ08836.1 hypothetical protein [Deltaproteobacteria bacterium]
MNSDTRQDFSQRENTGTLARVVRLTCKTLGGMLLFLLLILIIIGSPSQASLLNVVFWLAVAGLIVLRFIDIRVYHGQTADNKPATIRDWLNYSIGVVAMSGFFWVVAQAIRVRLH